MTNATTEQNALFALVRCPRCRGVLEGETGVLLCRTCAVRYPLVDGVPVLIDEKSSVFTHADFTGKRATFFAKESFVRRLIYGVLQSGVSYLIVFDDISEEGLIALSPLWVLGIVFGLAGLTIGRNSLKRSVIAALLSGVLLFLFFITLWGAL